MKYKLKNGGVLKGQFGLSRLSPSVINESLNRFKQTKVGTTLNNFFNGTDSNLSNEEYMQKHGYAKPVGGIGILGATVAPEWEGLEFPEITKYHYGVEAKIPKIISKPKPVLNQTQPPKVSSVVKPKPKKTSEQKHEIFMKGLNTFSERKYGVRFDNIKAEYKPRIEKEYRDLISKINKKKK